MVAQGAGPLNLGPSGMAPAEAQVLVVASLLDRLRVHRHRARHLDALLPLGLGALGALPALPGSLRSPR